VFYAGGACELAQCSSSETFATAEILKTGVVAKNNCPGGNAQHEVTANPGELVIFGKPWTRWQCMMLEIPWLVMRVGQTPG